MKKYFPNFILLLLSTYFSLLVADIFFYNFNYRPTATQTGLFINHETRGYALSPGFEGEIGNLVKFYVKINSKGYRDIEWQLEKPNRIAVLGDSFVFGYPLSLEEGISYKLRQKLGNEFSVFNLGLGGYGVAHVQATLSEISPLIRPTRVLYLYYQNDTRCDNMYVQSKKVINGELVSALDGCENQLSDQALLSRYEDFINERNTKLSSLLPVDELGMIFTLQHLRGFLAQRYLNPKQIVKKLLNIYDEGNLLTSDPIAYNKKYQELAAKMIVEMALNTEKSGTKFTMVILPHEYEAFYGLKEPATERLLENLKMSMKNLDVLDLRNKIDRGTSLVYPGEGHYSAEGTTLISDLILQHISSN